MYGGLEPMKLEERSSDVTALGQWRQGCMGGAKSCAKCGV